MKERKRSFDEIMDVFALKIIVDTPENCYRALGLVHSIYKPVDGRFKDYVALPKSNGYQSLHTTVLFNIDLKTIQENSFAGNASHFKKM